MDGCYCCYYCYCWKVCNFKKLLTVKTERPLFLPSSTYNLNNNYALKLYITNRKLFLLTHFCTAHNGYKKYYIKIYYFDVNRPMPTVVETIHWCVTELRNTIKNHFETKISTTFSHKLTYFSTAKSSDANSCCRDNTLMCDRAQKYHFDSVL
jgi:hypothetical protein